MHQRQYAIARLGNVDLEDAHPMIEIVLHRLDGVFRIAICGAAAMRGDHHAAIFTQAVEIFGQGQASLPVGCGGHRSA